MNLRKYLSSEKCFIHCIALSNLQTTGSSCSKPGLANPGLVKKFNYCYVLTLKGGFFTRLWFKKRKFVIKYFINLLGHNVVANPPLVVNK